MTLLGARNNSARRCFFMFFFLREISELRSPIAMKLCHVIESWLRFTINVLKFGGFPPKHLKAKTCEIWHDFGQFQNFKASIFGQDRDIKIRKTRDRQRFLTRSVKKVW